MGLWRRAACWSPPEQSAHLALAPRAHGLHQGQQCVVHAVDVDAEDGSCDARGSLNQGRLVCTNVLVVSDAGAGIRKVDRGCSVGPRNPRRHGSSIRDIDDRCGNLSTLGPARSCRSLQPSFVTIRECKGHARGCVLECQGRPYPASGTSDEEGLEEKTCDQTFAIELYRKATNTLGAGISFRGNANEKR